MVNYKPVVCNAAVLATVLAVAYATPVPSDTEEYYDLRQTNAEDNIRVKLENVLISVMPDDFLKITVSDLNDIELSEIVNLIKPPNSSTKLVKSDTEQSSNKVDKPNSENPDTPDSTINNDGELEVQKNNATKEKLEEVQRLKEGLAKVLIPLLKRAKEDKKNKKYGHHD